jgi:cyclophilin family peptidyl-prolyl cis-trans isomerase
MPSNRCRPGSKEKGNGAGVPHWTGNPHSACYPRSMKNWPIAVPVCLLCSSLLSGVAGTLAQFRTIVGDLEVELYDQQKPVTVQNFKRLVQSGAYEGTFFHRVVPGFVAEGGGYSTTIQATYVDFAPPWTYLEPVPHFGAISNEFNIGPRLSNTNGTIAMAKTGANPNSATCQWFFNLANNSTNLDNQNGGFTVFGRVISDTGPTSHGGVLGLLNGISFGDGLVNLLWWPALTNDSLANVFTNLPVTYSGTDYPWYSDLLYVDISLLNVQVTIKPQGVRQISWNSVSNKLNYVEFTTDFPPLWRQLLSTNGNGSTCMAIDASSDRRRFYRVRVAY